METQHKQKKNKELPVDTKDAILIDLIKRSLKKDITRYYYRQPRYYYRQLGTVSLKFIKDKMLDDISNMSEYDMYSYIINNLNKEVIETISSNVVNLVKLDRNRRIKKAKKVAAWKRENVRYRQNAKKKKEMVKKLSSKLNAKELAALKKLVPGFK